MGAILLLSPVFGLKRFVRTDQQTLSHGPNQILTRPNDFV